MTKEPEEMTWRELIEEAVAKNGDKGKEIFCTLSADELDTIPSEVLDDDWTAWCGEWIYHCVVIDFPGFTMENGCDVPPTEYEVGCHRIRPEDGVVKTKWK